VIVAVVALMSSKVPKYQQRETRKVERPEKTRGGRKIMAEIFS
jgi:hypothetical protein